MILGGCLIAPLDGFVCVCGTRGDLFPTSHATGSDDPVDYDTSSANSDLPDALYHQSSGTGNSFFVCKIVAHTVLLSPFLQETASSWTIEAYVNDRIASPIAPAALAIPRTPAASPLVAPASLSRLLSLTSIADTFMCVVTRVSDIIYLHALSH